jgi:hypothetical protein
MSLGRFAVETMTGRHRPWAPAPQGSPIIRSSPGRRVLDGSSGLICLPAGRCCPEIAAAAIEQLQTLEYTRPSCVAIRGSGFSRCASPSSTGTPAYAGDGYIQKRCRLRTAPIGGGWLLHFRIISHSRAGIWTEAFPGPRIAHQEMPAHADRRAVMIFLHGPIQFLRLLPAEPCVRFGRSSVQGKSSLPCRNAHERGPRCRR